MRLARIFALRFRSLLRRSAVEAELARELDLHLEALVRESVAAGMSEGDARAAARAEFGSPELARERCRDVRRLNLLEDLAKDVVYALRQMRKAPGFTFTAVLSFPARRGI